MNLPVQFIISAVRTPLGVPSTKNNLTVLPLVVILLLPSIFKRLAAERGLHQPGGVNPKQSLLVTNRNISRRLPSGEAESLASRVGPHLTRNLATFRLL